MKHRLPAGLVLISSLAVVSACSTTTEDIRYDLRSRLAYEVSEKLPAVELEMDILSDRLSGERLKASPFKSTSPEIRAQAAHNLGEYGDMRSFDLLLSRGLGELADSSSVVRRECVIALGKLNYSGPLDAQRLELIPALRERLIGDVTTGGITTFKESDPLVRRALLDTLITVGMPRGFDPDRNAGDVIGYRDVAGELHSIAVKLSSQDVLNRIRNNLTHEAMLERSFDGLAYVTATPYELSRSKREHSVEMRDYLSWWIERIRQMPLMESYARS